MNLYSKLYTLFSIYQNRDLDDEKSKKRAEDWDSKEVEKHPESATSSALSESTSTDLVELDRQLFYKAQTFYIVGQVSRAYDLYAQRTRRIGNIAHCHLSMYTCGLLAEERCDWKCALDWYHNALELGEKWTKTLCLASLLGLGRVYQKLKFYNLAYNYLHSALDCNEPQGDHPNFITWSVYDYTWRRYFLFGEVTTMFLHSNEKKKKGINALCKALNTPHLPVLYKQKAKDILNKKYYGDCYHFLSPYSGGSNLIKNILQENGYSVAQVTLADGRPNFVGSPGEQGKALWKHTFQWEKLRQRIACCGDHEKWIVCYRSPATWTMSMLRYSYRLQFTSPKGVVYFTGDAQVNEPKRKWPNLAECYLEIFTQYLKLYHEFPRKIRWVNYEETIVRQTPYLESKLNIRLDPAITEKSFQ